MTSPARALVGLLIGLLFCTADAAVAATPAAVGGDNLVQTAINGSYDSAGGTLTLHRVESSRTAIGRPAALVRTLALTQTFAQVFSEAAPLATLVVHDGAGDGRRSHHLVRVRAPQFIQSSNTITYSIEVLRPASPPPATIDRAFLVFGPGNLAAVTEPDPLVLPGDFDASELVEAVTTQAIRSGTYDPKASQLRLRGVEHVLLASGRVLRAATFATVDVVDGIRDAYRNSQIKPVAVFAWTAGNRSQQAIVRLEALDGYDAAADEIRYAISVLETTAALPASFAETSLTVPATISFGRGWPAHGVCCSCDAKCQYGWVPIGYCSTCISPINGDQCCKVCRIPPDPGGSPCPNAADGPALVAFGDLLAVGFVSGNDTRKLLVSGSKDGRNFASSVTVPNQQSDRGPGLTAFGKMVVMGYKANDRTNNLWATLSTDGLNFAGTFPVNGQQSPQPPALAVFQNKVWMAYQANDPSNQLFLVSSADGMAWSAALRIPGQTSQAKPAMAVFQGRLIVAYVANDDTNQLYTTSTSDLQSWTVDPIPNQGSDQAPALAVFNNQLFIAFTSNDETNRIFVASSADGRTFSNFVTIANQQTPQPPALAAFGGRLYLAYRANDRDGEIYVTSSADGQNFDFKVRLSGD